MDAVLRDQVELLTTLADAHEPDPARIKVYRAMIPTCVFTIHIKFDIHLTPERGF
jgi:hypothetical protein